VGTKLYVVQLELQKPRPKFHSEKRSAGRRPCEVTTSRSIMDREKNPAIPRVRPSLEMGRRRGRRNAAPSSAPPPASDAHGKLDGRMLRNPTRRLAKREARGHRCSTCPSRRAGTVWWRGSGGGC